MGAAEIDMDDPMENDEVVHLRFSDIPEDMDALISDIITEELSVMSGAQQPPGPPTGSNETPHPNPGNNPETEAAATAMSVSTDPEGRPSILSLRTSLMTPRMADQILEGLMTYNFNTNTKTPPSAALSVRSITPTLDDLPPSPRRTETPQQRRQEGGGAARSSQVSWGRISSVTQPSLRSLFSTMTNTGGSTHSMQMSTTSTADPFGHHSFSKEKTTNASRSRISITADPFIFAGGSGGIPIENTQDSGRRSVMTGSGTGRMPHPPQDPSMRSIFEQTSLPPASVSSPERSRAHSMRFSVAKSTMSMFDAPFDFAGTDLFDESAAVAVEIIPPVEVVSQKHAGSYLHESEQATRVAEQALEHEMQALSFHDKTQIKFDVHGIRSLLGQGPGGTNRTIPEPDNVDDYLRHLEDVLMKCPLQRKAAFVEAQHRNPSYVNSNEFRRMFLRAYLDRDTTTYDVHKAATKLMLHFQTKKMLFGPSFTTDPTIVGRDVRLSDLSAKDRIALQSGAFQILPERDTAGRAVVVFAPGQRIFDTIESWMRAMWYVYWLLSKDAENQLTGICMVVYFRGFTKKRDTYEQVKKLTLVRESMPTKLVALHFCYQDVAMNAMIVAHKVHFLTRNLRSRVRDHFSTDHNEICFQLETYGIPIDKEILKPNGHLGLKWFNEWMQIRESQEADHSGNDAGTTPSTIAVTITPRKFDVLFGRGRNTREHCGNLRCAHLVEMHQPEYEHCSKSEKTELAMRIVIMIKECDGRFLKKDRKTGWEEVEDTKAREKVSHFFRHLRATTLTNDQDDNGQDIKQEEEDQTEKRSRQSATDYNSHDLKQVKHVPI